VQRQSAIWAEGLTKRFGTVRALDGVDLELAPGGVLGLLGPNGAGKTTVVRILTTLLRADAGRGRVGGFDVMTQSDAVRRHIGLSGQFAAVDGYLSGQENLQMIGRLSGMSRVAATARADELLGRFDLSAVGGRQARTYSGGMRRRLDVAASLVNTPPVLFLDEPTTGLDPHGRLQLWALLEELTGRGVSVLLTTQYMEEADRLAHDIVVIDHGSVIARGTPDELKNQLGGDRLELRTTPGPAVQRLADALASLATAPPVLDVAAGRLVLPIRDVASILPRLAAQLANTELSVSDLAVRRPTLDDVFLALTGRPTASDDSAQVGANAVAFERSTALKGER
jgi:ABC-2 type transport system ATP-binding protein